MDLEEQIRKGEPEAERLEYKSKEVDPRKVAKEIAAMSNAAGGSIILGVCEDSEGRPDKVENIGSTDEVARTIADLLNHYVEPYPEFSTEIIEIEGKTQLAILVEDTAELSSYEHDTIEEPLFPIRRRTEIRYLTGHEVQNYFEEVPDADTNSLEDSLLRLPDEVLEERFSNYFIECPDGHISEICLFSPHYFPQNPHRVTAQLDYIPEKRAEHIFAVLEALFDLSIPDCHFTVNQSNGAWVGDGYRNFVANLRNREERYSKVNEGEYDLTLYDHDQAVLISDLDIGYPESSLLLYAAPFTSQEGYRHLTVNFLIDGQPVDVRPLVEFSRQTGMKLSTSAKVEIPTDGIQRPSRIPVDIITRTTRNTEFTDDSIASVDGAICRNPFYDKRELLQSELDVRRVTSIANYRHLRAYLRDWDKPENPQEYSTQHFLVNDWNDFTQGIYANVKQVQFEINW